MAEATKMPAPVVPLFEMPKFEMPKFDMPSMEVPAAFREFAEKGVAQAKDGYEKAKAAARVAMDSAAWPEHIDTGERREGVIAYIDRVTRDGREQIIDDLEFDDDRIHGRGPSVA